jgi:hypothetical protein
VLAHELGPRFEPHALTLLPTLFGVIVITVAVMAESADQGVRQLLRYCQVGSTCSVKTAGRPPARCSSQRVTGDF